jgi:hypothetical protein
VQLFSTTCARTCSLNRGAAPAGDMSGLLGKRGGGMLNDSEGTVPGSPRRWRGMPHDPQGRR